MDYKKHATKVEGSKKDPMIFMFTLSTCIWCKKTKALLKSLDIEHNFIDVDLVSDAIRDEVETAFEKANPEMSFPTILVDDGKEILVGFDDEKIKRLFNV